MASDIAIWSESTLFSTLIEYTYILLILDHIVIFDSHLFYIDRFR